MWRKTTGAKLSPPASSVQESARASAQPPETPATQKPSGDDSSLAAAAVALEKQYALAHQQAANEEPASAAVQETTGNSAPASELLAAVVAASSIPARAQDPAPSAGLGDGASRVCSGIKIRGEISGNTDLYIDGEVQGKLCFGNASVTVGPSGRVHADIEGREIIALGTVQGTLRAEESVRLGPQSRVKGNVFAPRIAIEDGARLSGKVDMTRASGVSSATTAPERAAKANALGAAV